MCSINGRSNFFDLFDLVGKSRGLFGCRSNCRYRGFAWHSESGSILDRLIRVPWDQIHVFWLHLGLFAVRWRDGSVLGFWHWGLWGRSVHIVNETMINLCGLGIVGHPAAVDDELVRYLVFPWNEDRGFETIGLAGEAKRGRPL